jgi:hypothetical protein
VAASAASARRPSIQSETATFDAQRHGTDFVDGPVGFGLQRGENFGGLVLRQHFQGIVSPSTKYIGGVSLSDLVTELEDSAGWVSHSGDPTP